MVKLVYTYALGAYAIWCAGSSPVSGTIFLQKMLQKADLALREQVLSQSTIFFAKKLSSKKLAFLFLRML